MSDKANKIIDFLNGIVPDPHCAYCGKDTLELLQENGEPLKYNSLLWNSVTKGMPQYAVGCTTCGHVHFFAKKHIDHKNGITEE